MTKTEAIPANGAKSAVAGCPSGATILGGGCRAINSGGLTLAEGGIDRVAGDAYICSWLSTAPEARMATAEAICLIPAP